MKLKQFQNYLAEQKIDLTCFIHPDSNITYFTQIKPSKAVLEISPHKAKFYLSHLDSKPQIKHIQTEKLSKDWLDKINAKNIKKIGINKEKITLHSYEELKKKFPKASFTDISTELKQLRMQKTPEEIEKITKAGKITVKAFNSLVDNFSLKRFRTEKDIAFFLEKYIYEQNVELAFPVIIAMGRNAAIPHHQTSNAKLKKGFLLLDFGACYQNYCSDMSRVIYIGKPSQKERELYNLLLNTQMKLIENISEGRKFSELGKEARILLGKYSSYFTHNLGHGVGIDIHEKPSFLPEENESIAQNNVFTIEPGIYFPGKYGLRIEDTVLFDNKVKVLTKAPKELVEVEYR